MTTANHDQLGSRCKAHIDQATRTAYSRFSASAANEPEPVIRPFRA
jgi:hypothetical protein